MLHHGYRKQARKPHGRHYATPARAAFLFAFLNASRDACPPSAFSRRASFS
jgi:hypothetical protein